MGRSQRANPITGVLLLACPKVDLEQASSVCQQHGTVVLPAGGVGDLALCDPLAELFIVEIDLDNHTSQFAAKWRALLGPQLPLDDAHFNSLLPSTWLQRHPNAYAQARAAQSQDDDDAGTATDNSWELQWQLDGEPISADPERAMTMQVFLPVTHLRRLHKSEWIFTNELVRKQHRRGRSFIPRVPTRVALPD